VWIRSYLSSYSLRIPKLKKKEVNDLLINLTDKIRQVKIEIKKYKNSLLMNESIYFEKYEKSSSFGELTFYSNKTSNILSKDFGRVIKSFTAHSEFVIPKQVDYKSNKLITISKDNEIKIFNLETGQCLTSLIDKIYATDVKIIPNNKLISTHPDKTLKIWDLNSYECLSTLKNETYVYSLCLISDNQIACGCMDGSIHIWDLNSLIKVKKFKAHDNQILMLFSVDKTNLISLGLNDRRIKIWNIQTFEKNKKIDSKSSNDCLELSSDGILFILTWAKNTMYLWQIETCQMLKSIKFEFDIYCFKILTDDLIAFGLDDGIIKVYNYNKMEKIKTISAGEYYSIDHLLLLSNGNLVSESNGEIKNIKIFEENSEQFKGDIDSFESHQLRNEIKESLIKLNQLIEDYEIIDAKIYIFDYIGEIINRIDLHREELLQEINQISDEIIKQLINKEEKCLQNKSNLVKMNLKQLSDDLKYSLKTCELKEDILNDFLFKINEKIKVFQNETEMYKKDLLMKEAIYFDQHPKSSTFGTISFYSNKSNVLSKECGELIKTYTGHSDLISSIQIDEKSNRLISASNDKTIKIWNLESGECLKTLDHHTHSILIIPNNKFISQPYDTTIKIWDLNSYECLKTLFGILPYVWSLCLISDNQIACGCVDGSVNIWNLDNSTKIKTFKAHDDYINYLLLFDKTKLLSCSDKNDKKIKIWSLETFTCIKVFQGHSDDINHLKLTSEGNLLSCSQDKTVKLWQIETGEILKSIQFEHPVYLVIPLNDNLIAVALENGDTHIYNYDKMEIIKTISNSVYFSEARLLNNGDFLIGSNNGEIKLFKMLENK
jgi:WD40 repeat protein